MNNVVVFKNITSANIMVFSRGISVKNESMSELPMKLHESCSAIVLNITAFKRNLLLQNS